MSIKGTNKMTGLRRVVTRRGTNPIEEARDKQEEAKEAKEAEAEPPRPRTRADEEIYIHTATLKEPLRRTLSQRSNSGNPIHRVYSNGMSERKTTTAPLTAIIDDALNRLNLQGAASFVRSCLTVVSHYVISSRYVSTEWRGQLHLQSFGLGAGSIVMMIFLYPYFGRYFQQWFEVFGSLFRHVALLGIVVLVISYISNPEVAVKEKKVNHNYTELEYSVKSSDPTRPSSPTKKVRRALPRRETEPIASRRSSEAQMLVSLTEQQQFLERARQDSGAGKHRDPYDKFMSGAFKEEGNREKYNNFIDEAAKMDEERQKYNNFVGANRDQIMRKRD